MPDVLIARSCSDSRKKRGRNGCGRRLGEREMMKGLYCGGALAALAAASAASAQTAPLAEPQAKAGLPADVIADIIVTARKREENLQETPIAISAFGNETLEARGATRVDAIAGSTPNLT